MVFLSLGLILISLSMGKKSVWSIPFLQKSDFFLRGFLNTFTSKDKLGNIPQPQRLGNIPQSYNLD